MLHFPKGWKTKFNRPLPLKLEKVSCGRTQRRILVCYIQSKSYKFFRDPCSENTETTNCIIGVHAQSADKPAKHRTRGRRLVECKLKELDFACYLWFNPCETFPGHMNNTGSEKQLETKSSTILTARRSAISNFLEWQKWTQTGNTCAL